MLVGHRYDVCIIGAGPAGASVAHRCATAGLRVLLIEAGPRLDRAQRAAQQRRFLMLGLNPWPSNAARDVFRNTSEFAYPLNANRVRAVGGTSLHWIGMAPRLRPTDFETLTRFGRGVDWPIRYTDLEAYYVQAENALGVSGNAYPESAPRSAAYPMSGFPDGHGDALWRRAADRLGARLETMPVAKNNLQSFDGRPACAAHATCTICPIGAQYSADWHVAKAEATGNCTVLAETSARRVDVDSEGRLRVVHATSSDGTQHEVTCVALVVAGNAVETPRLLLQSKIGNPAHLGRHLMEHWKIAATGVSAERDFPGRIGFPVLTSYHWYNAGAERGAIRMLFPNADDPLERFGSEERWGAKMAQEDCERFGHLRRIEVSAEHLPNDDSRVTLDEDLRDVFGDPAPRLHFALSAVDHATMDAGRAALREMADSAALSEISIGRSFYGGAHLMGTCRMAQGEQDGVADSYGKVFGTENVYLAGSSLFPTGGAVNPTLTIVALSLRLADRLVNTVGRNKVGGR